MKRRRFLRILCGVPAAGVIVGCTKKKDESAKKPGKGGKKKGAGKLDV